MFFKNPINGNHWCAVDVSAKSNIYEWAYCSLACPACPPGTYNDTVDACGNRVFPFVSRKTGYPFHGCGAGRKPFEGPVVPDRRRRNTKLF